MITPPIAKSRSERQRRPKNHQVAVAYTVWAVLAVGIAVFGWVAAELFRADTEPTSKPERQAVEAKVSGVRSGAEDDAEAERHVAAILKRDREQREVKAKAREAERLKLEVQQLKAEKRKRESAAREREAAAASKLQREFERAVRREPRVEPVFKPPTPEEAIAKAAAQAREREAAAKRGVIQDLVEKAVVYRANRDPEELLVVLLKLKKLRPTDPAVAYSLGEVYGSFGEHFNSAKACSEFRRFLRLTTESVFDPASFHKLYSFQTSNFQEVRMTAQRYVARLKKKHKLLLVTPTRRIADLVSGLEKEREDRRKTVSKCETRIAGWERQIAVLRRSRRFGARSRITTLQGYIRNYRKTIAKQEKQITFITAELTRIRDATR